MTKRQIVVRAKTHTGRTSAVGEAMKRAAARSVTTVLLVAYIFALAAPAWASDVSGPSACAEAIAAGFYTVELTDQCLSDFNEMGQ